MARLTWTLTYYARPWTLNAERQAGRRGSGVGGHYGRAKLVREWREAYFYLAKEAQIPPLKWITVEVHPVIKDRRFPDVAAGVSAVKAAVDGLVDAKVIPDDGPKYVHMISFYAAEVGEKDALILTISGEPEE